eukprot:6046543-Pyramimonas_sp.AAC.1
MPARYELYACARQAIYLRDMSYILSASVGAPPRVSLESARARTYPYAHRPSPCDSTHLSGGGASRGRTARDGGGRHCCRRGGPALTRMEMVARVGAVRTRISTNVEMNITRAASCAPTSTNAEMNITRAASCAPTSTN